MLLRNALKRSLDQLLRQGGARQGQAELVTVFEAELKILEEDAARGVREGNFLPSFGDAALGRAIADDLAQGFEIEPRFLAEQHAFMRGQNIHANDELMRELRADAAAQLTDMHDLGARRLEKRPAFGERGFAATRHIGHRLVSGAVLAAADRHVHDLDALRGGRFRHLVDRRGTNGAVDGDHRSARCTGEHAFSAQHHG